MKLTNFNLWGKLNNHLHLMPHVCVRRFDMMGIVQKKLETKQGLITVLVKLALTESAP